MDSGGTPREDIRRFQIGQHQGLGTNDTTLRTTIGPRKLLFCLQSYVTGPSLPPLTMHKAVPAPGGHRSPSDSSPAGSPAASLTPSSLST